MIGWYHLVYDSIPYIHHESYSSLLTLQHLTPRAGPLEIQRKKTGQVRRFAMDLRRVDEGFILPKNRQL